jgi:hypothetical protein
VAYFYDCFFAENRADFGKKTRFCVIVGDIDIGKQATGHL